MDTKREMLRHTLSTLAYRANRALENSSEAFGAFDGCGKPPVVILAHMGDLMEWALSMAEGNSRWQNSSPLAWQDEQSRFFAALTALDQFLALGRELKAPPERLFQGPVADALTHVGQLAMLRRLAEESIRGENFFLAEITLGKTGSEQAAPKKTF